MIENNSSKPRVIAYYLPQYHPIPENDLWWGKGFTEWTNVGKAKPLFRGHYQPKVPADLGYYDLRMAEVREEQAKLAKEAGIEGFCYWHYWFGNGKQLLERPFAEVLESGAPDFPFCLGWANHSWTNKSWHSGKRFVQESILMEQTYPGKEEHIFHFNSLLKAFQDKRYIQIDGKPVFVIFRPLDIPDVEGFIKLWNDLAIKNSLKGIHFVGITQNLESFKKTGIKGLFNDSNSQNSANIYQQILDLGFNAINSRGSYRAQIMAKGKFFMFFLKAINNYFDGFIVDKYNYKKIIKYLYVEEDAWENVYPTLIPNWDRTARSGKKSQVWYGSTPELFKESVEMALDSKRNNQNKILFLQSWNEWAEGNYIEPDLLFGRNYLKSLKDVLHRYTV